MKEKTFVTLIDPPNGTQCSVLKIKNDSEKNRFKKGVCNNIFIPKFCSLSGVSDKLVKILLNTGNTKLVPCARSLNAWYNIW